jgi:hypothetical protein
MAYILQYITKLKSEVMKTMKMNLVNLFLVIGFFGIFLNVNSQDLKQSRLEQKEERDAVMAANFHILDSLLNAKSFVLEADYLQNKYGYMVPVVSDLNFIKVDNSNCILQTGSNFSVGYNGVGGVTAQGSLGSWKVDKNFKTLSYSLRFNIQTNIGQYDIFMTVTSDNNATATISGNFGDKLTWRGHLVTVNNSRVFKGQDII